MVQSNMNDKLPVMLVMADTTEKLKEVFDLMTNEKGIKEFYTNKLTNIITSRYTFIIKLNDTTVGLINLVREEDDNNFLFLDIGIKEEYRNKGIATEMMKFISTIPIKEYVLVKSNNIYVNKALKELGCNKVYEHDFHNIYLLQNNKYKQFIENNVIEKLAKHFNPTKYYSI